MTSCQRRKQVKYHKRLDMLQYFNSLLEWCLIGGPWIECSSNIIDVLI